MKLNWKLNTNTLKLWMNIQMNKPHDIVIYEKT